jgi:hypothetical protein
MSGEFIRRYSPDGAANHVRRILSPLFARRSGESCQANLFAAIRPTEGRIMPGEFIRRYSPDGGANHPDEFIRHHSPGGRHAMPPPTAQEN